MIDVLLFLVILIQCNWNTAPLTLKQSINQKIGLFELHNLNISINIFRLHFSCTFAITIFCNLNFDPTSIFPFCNFHTTFWCDGGRIRMVTAGCCSLSVDFTYYLNTKQIFIIWWSCDANWCTSVLLFYVLSTMSEKYAVCY